MLFRDILAEPSNDTPAIVLAVARVAAVVAVPEVQTVLSPVFVPEVVPEPVTVPLAVAASQPEILESESPK